MTYSLVIVESPAKCSKIENYLGSGYKCLASYGHLTQLSSLKNIDITNNYKPSFNIDDKKRQQINKLQKAITDSREVILATDDDREGEAIAWHICQLFQLPVESTKRILFNEITQSALQNAINNPTIINMNLVHAQQARQILDLLVGYKITPLLWQNISSNSKESLSAGRCQTPALRLVYENHKEIQEHPGKKVYNTIGYFTNKNLPFVLNHNHNGEKEITEFLEKTKIFNHELKINEAKTLYKNPPSPLTTSGLQQLANNEMRITPKETMSICQKLYEGGYITYMRTDSKTYSKEFISKASDYINKNYGEEYKNSNISKLSERLEIKEGKIKKEGKSKKDTKNKKENNAQEAHEAIRPTDINKIELSKELSNKEQKMYKLIWNTTIESCMASAQFLSIIAQISAPDNYNYKLTAEQSVFLGWKIIQGHKEDLNFNYFKSLKNDTIPYKKITSKVTMKDLKTHYTEAKLVQLLEQKGIGRPSTFSSLIDKIQERKYVKKENIKGKKINCIDFELDENNIKKNEVEKEFGNENNKLVIQPIGIFALEFLLKHCNDLFIYDYTKTMENNLDLIAKGNMVWYELCDECNKQLIKIISPLSKKSNKKTIQIDENHEYMIAKYGPVIKCTEGDKITFKPVKKDIDIDKLQNKEYTLEELIEEKQDNSGKLLGDHNGELVYLKKGKFGLYLVWGENKQTLKNINLKEHEITLENIKQYLLSKIVREINNNLSIRNGKYGDYIFYQTSAMKKPRFYALNGFEDDYKKCNLSELKEWILTKHNIT